MRRWRDRAKAFYYGTDGSEIRMSWLAARQARRHGSVLYLWSEKATGAWDRVHATIERPPKAVFVTESVSHDVTVMISESVERFARAGMISIGYRPVLRPGFVASTWSVIHGGGE